MSFEIFVVTYRVTNFLPKLVDMLQFSTEKTEFPFLVFPYYRVMPNATEESNLPELKELDLFVTVFGGILKASNTQVHHKAAVDMYASSVLFLTSKIMKFPGQT